MTTNPKGVHGSMSYTYLASPYSHLDKAVMERRFIDVCRISAALMMQGRLVFSPIAHTHPIACAAEMPKGWEFWEKYDRVMIEHAQDLLVVKMDGWQQSTGVTAEIKIAAALSKPIDYLDPAPFLTLPAQESVLAEADRLVQGDRGSAYGHPADDFAKTARIWSGILMPKLLPHVLLSPQDVGLCMVGVKLSRQVNQHKRDNLVDAAGYAKCVAMIEERRAEEAA